MHLYTRRARDRCLVKSLSRWCLAGTIPEPTERLRPHRTSNIKFPLPQARSPMKTHTGSSPRRSVGPLSPSKRQEVDTPLRAFSHPPPSSLAKRKFDDSTDESIPPSGRPSKLKRPIRTPPSARASRNSFDVEDQPEPDETIGLTNGDMNSNGYIDDDTPIPGIEDESLQVDQGLDNEDIEEETALEAGVTEEEPFADREISQVQESKQNPPKKRIGRVSTNANVEDSRLSDSARRRPGRPPKVHRDVPAEGANSVSNFKSPSQKTKQPLRGRDPNPKVQPRRQSISKAPSRAGSRARSLIVQRSETPAEGSGALVTRSGRHSIKPLASWRGERAVFESGTLDENGLTLGAIREIIRTDEIIEPRPRKYPGRKKRAQSARLDDVEEEDEDMEDWERETGVISASVMGWDAVEGHFIEDQLETQG